MVLTDGGPRPAPAGHDRGQSATPVDKPVVAPRRDRRYPAPGAPATRGPPPRRASQECAQAAGSCQPSQKDPEDTRQHKGSDERQRGGTDAVASFVADAPYRRRSGMHRHRRARHFQRHSTHPLSILPARGRGGSCTEVSTRDPRGVLPGAGEGASGSSNLRVEASGHESSYGVLLRALRHMIGAAVSSSSAKADSFAAE